jgi:hypothetical protein
MLYPLSTSQLSRWYQKQSYGSHITLKYVTEADIIGKNIRVVQRYNYLNNAKMPGNIMEK